MSLSYLVLFFTFAAVCCASGAQTLFSLPARADGVPIRGVNLGGWLVLEPWIRPSLFERFEHLPPVDQAIDEWSLCAKLGHKAALSVLTKHYEEWVTERDIAQLAYSGINTIRIPIGYWAVIPLLPDEPYVGYGNTVDENGDSVQVKYLRCAIEWARKYRLQVIFDLHGAPGSQNGFDNSGKRGKIHWHKYQPNIDRTVVAVQQLAKIANEYPGVVTMVQPLNEPVTALAGENTVVNFYRRSFDAITKESKTTVNLHTGFLPLQRWESLVQPEWRSHAVLDVHIYYCFNGYYMSMTMPQILKQVEEDGPYIWRSHTKALPTMVGEWSLAITDCTKWINGFGRLARYNGTYVEPPLDDSPLAELTPVVHGSCEGKSGSVSTFSAEYKAFLRDYFNAQRASYERYGMGWIMWNFKAEQAPEWSYLDGLANGWIPQ
ncbi:glycoside hydrolase, partial [Ramicandelaber brevisporus]